MACSEGGTENSRGHGSQQSSRAPTKSEPLTGICELRGGGHREAGTKQLAAAGQGGSPVSPTPCPGASQSCGAHTGEECDHGHRQAGTTKIRPYLGSRAAASSRGTSQTGMGVNEELEKDGSPPTLKPVTGICQVTPNTLGDPPRKVTCPPPAVFRCGRKGTYPQEGQAPRVREIPSQGRDP